MNKFLKARWRFAAVLTAAVALAAVLVGASQISAREPKPEPQAAASAASAHEPSLFAGLPQQGIALGSPKAPVTLVEYADLQCPYCAQWAQATLPTLVADYVRSGKLRIVFHGLAFIGPDSDKALRTAHAAGRENHLWDVVHGLYQRQGAENAGWVTDDLVEQIAAHVPGLDPATLLEDAREPTVEPQLKRAEAAAEAAGVQGTPAFQVGPTGGPLELVQVSSLGPEGIVPAIEASLAR
jgi:protein-disulfide isomerase